MTVGETPQLWVLHKLKEERTVSVGGRGRNNSAYLRKDTYFHFEVQAFDPATVRPSWLQRVASFHDPDLKPNQRKPSRIVGSQVTGRLLGQDGELVWLLVGNQPYALDAASGAIVHERAGIEQRHPALAGMLPSEERLVGFDQGLVLTLADARRVRLHGRELALEDYVPRPAAAPAPELKANGMPRIVQMRPGVPMVRHVTRGENEWLALYTDKEAADAANDGFGDHVRYPYSIDDEGPLARRSFRRVRLAPTTRIDDTGRLVMSRLGPDLGTRWQVELPITDGGTDLPVYTWQIDRHLVAVGYAQSTRDEVRSRVPHLASVSLDDGRLAAWNLSAGAPPGEPPRFPRDE